jgi:hypothetical protein
MTFDYVHTVDHKFFSAHPDTDVFLREFIVGEFHKARLPCSAPPPGYRFAVHVQAFRDPCTSAVIMWIRSLRIVTRDTPLQWYVRSIIALSGDSR